MPTTPEVTPAYGVSPPSFRLPDATHLGRVRLQIDNLERSIAYYETVIGLRVLDRVGSVATLGAHGSDAVIVELQEKPGVRPVSSRGRIGLYHFAILLPDRASLGRFVRHLGDLGVYAGMSDHLVSEAVYLQDPDGLGIEVYADRSRDEWRVEHGQIAMATIPLDVPNLLLAAGADGWRGAPAGAMLGHVHLYVRDLELAAAFYHDGLGLAKVVWGYPGALFMSAGGYHHHLGTNTWAAGAPPATDEDARLLEWEIVVPDTQTVAAAARSLGAGGFDVAEAGADAVVRDPWGTQLRLIATGARV